MSSPSVSGLRVVVLLVRRELLRFLRQPARLAASIGTPLLLWLIVGSGFAGSFALAPEEGADVSYAAYLLPGVLTLTAMFTAIFSSISIIEDRAQGWLQSVLVSPAPRWSIAAGLAMGAAASAWLQSLLLMPLAPFVMENVSGAGVAISAAAVLVACVALGAMGTALAWRCETTAAFHGVMNLVFLPMWVLSGAFFPIQGASSWMTWVMMCNPLHWCTQAIRGPLTGEPWAEAMGLAGAFAAGMAALAVVMVSQRQRG